MENKIIRMLYGLSTSLFIVGIIGFMFFGAFTLVDNYLEKAENNIEACQGMGYDGVEFVSKWNNEMQCANFTDLERHNRKISPVEINVSYADASHSILNTAFRSWR